MPSLVTRVCENCSATFVRTSNQLPPSKLAKGGGRFCSKKCWFVAKRTLPEKTCMSCGKTFHARSQQKNSFCSMACRTGPVWSEVLRQRVIPKGKDHGNAVWLRMPDEQARDLFERYKSAKTNIQVFANTVGGSPGTLMRLFRNKFPAEYEDFVELKMDTKTSNYERGRNFEWRVRDHFRKRGYRVWRSPQSRGPADLIALKALEPPTLIQCKLSGKLLRKERAELVSLATELRARALLVWRGPSPKYELIIETVTDEPPGTQQNNPSPMP